MLKQMVEKAREEKILCREDTATEQRVLALLLYHAGLSYRKIERLVQRFHVQSTVGTTNSVTSSKSKETAVIR